MSGVSGGGGIPGYRPLPAADPEAGGAELRFTPSLTFEAVGDSTRYSVRVIHARRAGALTHDEMRFSAGWSTALDQLVARMTAASGE